MANSHRSIFLLLTVITILLLACTFPFFSSLTTTPHTGFLDVDIDYTGDFYRDYFAYSREAENVWHFVLILPASEADKLPEPGRLFISILPEADTITLDQTEYEWALEYLYEAPEGRFTGEFDPGSYLVSAALLTVSPDRAEDAPPSPAQGGASTDYQTIDIEPGETTAITVEITDDDGWACPWLYVSNGDMFERRTEILRNLGSEALEQTEITSIGSVTAVDGFIVVRIAEEKDEVTFLDAISLQFGEQIVPAEADSDTASQLAAIDGNYLTLQRSEMRELRFRAPESFADGDSVSVIATGYYVPA